MANKKILRYALLLSLGAIMMISVSAESDSSASDSTESVEVKNEDGSTTTTTTTATTAAPSKADIKSIEKLFLGSFRLTSDLKDKAFNKFLKAMGTASLNIRGFEKRDRDRIRNAPYIDMYARKIHSKKYNVKIYAGVILVQDATFRLGKEYKDKLIDGRTYKATVTFEGKNKVIVDEKHAGFTCHNEFVFENDELTANLDCKGVKATQEFENKEEPKPYQHPKFKLEFGK